MIRIKFKIYLFLFFCIGPFNSLAQNNQFNSELIYKPEITNISKIEYLDVNADYIKDIVLINTFDDANSNEIVVYINKLNNSLDTYFKYPIKKFSSVLEIIDFDQDSDFDIILERNDSLFLLEQHCFMDFKDEYFLYSSENLNHESIRFFNFNNDNYIDVLQIKSNTIEIFYNDSLEKKLTHTTELAISLENLYQIEDFNFDGRDDFLLSSYAGAVVYLDLILNKDDTTFQSNKIDSSDLLASSTPWIYRTAVFGDIKNTNENAIFLFAVSAVDYSLFSYVQTSPFTFEKKEISNNLDIIYSLDFADLNKDGYKELLCNSKFNPIEHQEKVPFYYENINGNILDNPIFNPNLYLPNITIDSNEKMDAVFYEFGLLQSYTNFNGTFYSDTSLLNFQSNDFPISHLYDIFIEDLNNNGKLEFITPSPNYHLNKKNYIFYNNDGNGIFSYHSTLQTNQSNSNALSLIEDINDDGLKDLIFDRRNVSTNLNEFVFYKNLGNYKFQLENIQVNLNEPISPFSNFIDIDGQNGIDLILIYSNFGNRKILTFLNDGTGSFNQAQELENVGTIIGLEDYDNNGFKDIMFKSFISDFNPYIYYSNGDGTFTGKDNLQNYNTTTNDMTTADIDNDGFLDLIDFSFEDANYKFYKNDGTGNFSFQAEILGTLGKVFTLFQDMNNDGYPELLSSFTVEDKFCFEVFEGNELLNYEKSIYTYCGTSKIGKISEFKDFDKDSDLDFFLINRNNELHFLRNTAVENNFNNPFIQEEIEFSSLCHNLSLPNTFEHVEVSIYSLNGQKIKSETYYDTNQISNNFNAPKGLYILKAHTNTKEEFIFKILK